MGDAARVRYDVSLNRARLCADFIIDQQKSGEDVALPEDLNDAVFDYDEAPTVRSVEDVREAIERWLLVDRDACIGLLGPGLGFDR